MRFTIENLLLIAALILFEAWFLKGYFSGSPEFEPAIGLILTLGAVFTKEPIKEKFGLGSKRIKHDKELYEQFIKDLPEEPTIRFLREHDFGDSFRRLYAEPLYKFVATWDSVEKEFIDKKIEKKKKSLYDVAKEFSSELANKTVSVSDGNFASVFSDRARHLHAQRPKFVIEDAKFLNDKATEFTPIYDNFVRFCKQRILK